MKTKKSRGRLPGGLNPHTKEGKDFLDRRRMRRALQRGLDLKKAILVATDGGKKITTADAALRRVEKALKNKRLGVGWKSHLDQAILKYLVGEGYLRVERNGASRGKKRRDDRFAPSVSYILTKKAKKLIGESSGGLPQTNHPDRLEQPQEPPLGPL